MAEILVVEDYPPMATAVARLLRGEGHQVVRELSVAGALRHKFSFDCAVLDIDLPDGNGVDLAEYLLANERVKNFVFFTATHELSLLRRAAGYGQVVDKSDGTRKLLASVQQTACEGLESYERPDAPANDGPNSRVVTHSEIFSLRPHKSASRGY